MSDRFWLSKYFFRLVWTCGGGLSWQSFNFLALHFGLRSCEVQKRCFKQSLMYDWCLKVYLIKIFALQMISILTIVCAFSSLLLLFNFCLTVPLPVVSNKIKLIHHQMYNVIQTPCVVFKIDNIFLTHSYTVLVGNLIINNNLI